MVEVWKKVFFQNYANFNGRASRKEFWTFAFVNVMISLMFWIGLGAVSNNLAIIVSVIYRIAVVLPEITVAIRRLQDQDLERWNIFIPFYNLYLLSKEGTIGPNHHGDDPREMEELIELGKDLN
jgi:uncharacterized membrane protein YhaH (DUF805 family)